MEKIAKALVKAQLELKNPEKNVDGYNYKYSDLASIIEQTKPVLEKNGLAVVQLACDDGNGRVGVETVLMHESGETLTSKLTLPIPDMKGSTVTQQAGAAITYARRYALSAILNITSEEDTDASNKKSASQETSTNQTIKSQDTTIVNHDQPGPALCERHNVEMKVRKGPHGWYHSHSRQNSDGNWEYCNNGKGFPDEQPKYEESIQ